MYGCPSDPEPKTPEVIEPEVAPEIVEIIELGTEVTGTGPFIEIIEPETGPFIEIIEPEITEPFIETIEIVEPFVEIIEPETEIIDPYIGPIDPTEFIQIIEFDSTKDEDEAEVEEETPKLISLSRPIKITVKRRNSAKRRDLVLRLKIKL